MAECVTKSKQETIPYYLGLRLISGGAARALLKSKYGVELQDSDVRVLRQAAALINPSSTESDIDTGLEKRDSKTVISDATIALGRLAVNTDEVVDALGTTVETLTTLADGDPVASERIDMADGVISAIRSMATRRRELEISNPLSEVTY